MTSDKILVWHLLNFPHASILIDNIHTDVPIANRDFHRNYFYLSKYFRSLNSKISISTCDFAKLNIQKHENWEKFWSVGEGYMPRTPPLLQRDLHHGKILDTRLSLQKQNSFSLKIVWNKHLVLCLRFGIYQIQINEFFQNSRLIRWTKRISAKVGFEPKISWSLSNYFTHYRMNCACGEL